MDMWKQWCQPYYTVNFGVILSYALVRQLLPGAISLRTHSGAWFATQEREIFMLVGFGLLSKARRATSLHEYIYKISLYGKVAIGLCLARSQSYGALALYICLLSFLFAVLPIPRFAGSELVDSYDAARFAERVLRLPQKPDTQHPMWLVMFTASWCESCLHVTPLFCSLAAQHSSTRRKFVMIDVADNPTIARRFNIDTSYKTLQLPTFALFYAGREKLRLPYFQGNKIVKTRFTRDSLQSFFLLDRSYNDALFIINKADDHTARQNAQKFIDTKRGNEDTT